jgi:hypothetical protein
MTNSRPPGRGWDQPSPRAEMLAAICSLDSAARVDRLAVAYKKNGYIDDEVVVTLLLDAWAEGRTSDENTYASVVLRRVTKHVKAHARKNLEWQRLGGGIEAVADDFCSEIIVNILKDTNVPCHAEVAFGDYVSKRCKDQFGKLSAKKHSAGQTLDGDESDEADAESPTVRSFESVVGSQSPEQTLIALQEFRATQETLNQVRRILQDESFPEKPAQAFAYRYLQGLKIASKNANEVTVTSLMKVTEKTATKYINTAIEIIRQRLGNDE